MPSNLLHTRRVQRTCNLGWTNPLQPAAEVSRRDGAHTLLGRAYTWASKPTRQHRVCCSIDQTNTHTSMNVPGQNTQHINTLSCAAKHTGLLCSPPHNKQHASRRKRRLFKRLYMCMLPIWATYTLLHTRPLIYTTMICYNHCCTTPKLTRTSTKLARDAATVWTQTNK